ncbi:MAG: trypsin-like peptidase domain-containing protein [Planctomycetaceae bacterium]|nr:trypsin-like peptidase domain-containing protein [Planctomycetaceae bacterium]
MKAKSSCTNLPSTDSSLRVESILLTVTRVATRNGESILTNATGFFFERDDELFLITNRHVVCDEPSNHRPDGLELELHISEANIAEVTSFYIPLYKSDTPCWREASDSAGLTDVVAIPIDRDHWPENAVYRAFTPQHLVEDLHEAEVGTSLLVIGFPLGFFDQLLHLPVARQAIIASAFGFRFQGSGCFLTDSRTHRGLSGAPVVSRFSNHRGRAALPYALLGVHASRLDVGVRDPSQDESLGLNCAWYADVIMPLTEKRAADADSAESPSTEESDTRPEVRPATAVSAKG